MRYLFERNIYLSTFKLTELPTTKKVSIFFPTLFLILVSLFFVFSTGHNIIVNTLHSGVSL